MTMILFVIMTMVFAVILFVLFYSSPLHVLGLVLYKLKDKHGSCLGFLKYFF